jgi:hypothetical protein
MSTTEGPFDQEAVTPEDVHPGAEPVPDQGEQESPVAEGESEAQAVAEETPADEVAQAAEGEDEPGPDPEADLG